MKIWIYHIIKREDPYIRGSGVIYAKNQKKARKLLRKAYKTKHADDIELHAIVLNGKRREGFIELSSSELD